MSVLRVRPEPPPPLRSRSRPRRAERRPASGRARVGPGPALLAAILLALIGLLPALALISRDAWRQVTAPGPVGVDTLATAATGPVALGIAAWLLLAIVAAAADAVLQQRPAAAAARLAGSADAGSPRAWFEPPPMAPRRSTTCARRIAPAVLRHAVAALLGVTLLGSPASATAGRPDGASVTATAGPVATGEIEPLTGWLPAPPLQRSGPASTAPPAPVQGAGTGNRAGPGFRFPFGSERPRNRCPATGIAGRHRRRDVHRTTPAPG